MKTKLTFLSILFVSLLQAQSLAWTSSLTGSNNSGSFYLTSDGSGSGNVYNTGYFSNTIDFDPGPGTFTLTSAGASAYVTKLDASGNLLWAVNLNRVGLGNSSSNGRYGLCSDPAGNVFVIGFFIGTCDFDPGVGVYTLTAVVPSNAAYQTFVWKLNSNGTFAWAKQVPGNMSVVSCAADASGNLLLGGSFSSTSDFDWGAGVSTITAVGIVDGFVSKLDAAGNFIEVKHFPSNANGYNGISTLAFDALQNLQATGTFSLSVDADPGVGTSILNSTDLQNFAVRLNSSGSVISAFSFPSSINTSTLFSTVQDAFGNLFVSGRFTGTCDIDPSSSVYNLQTASPLAAFLYKLDASGNFLWAKSFEVGAIQNQIYPFVKTDGNGRVYLSCTFSGTVDCDPGPGTQTLSSPFGYFVTILNASGNFESAIETSAYIEDIDQSGNFYTSTGSGPIVINKYSSIFTGIKTNQKNDLQVSVFPNPGNGAYTLTSDIKVNKLLLQIYAMNGQKLIEEFVEGGSTSIDLKNYPAGIYMLRLSDESNNVMQKKLIKE